MFPHLLGPSSSPWKWQRAHPDRVSFANASSPASGGGGDEASWLLAAGQGKRYTFSPTTFSHLGSGSSRQADECLSVQIHKLSQTELYLAQLLLPACSLQSEPDPYWLSLLFLIWFKLLLWTLVSLFLDHHLAWEIFFPRFLLFSFLSLSWMGFPRSLFCSFWVAFITFMHLNLSWVKLQEHCHPVLFSGWCLFSCLGSSSI